MQGRNGRSEMKRLSVLLVGLCLAVTCVGCAGGQSDNNASNTGTAQNSGTAQNTKSNSDKPQDLTVVDSGYILSNGYIMYALAIQNPNDNYLAQFAHVNVVSKDASGTILSSDDWTLGGICPSTTTYWASQAGNGSVTEGTQVEITVSVDSSDWKESDVKLPAELYTFSGTSVTPSNFGYLQGTGQVTLNEEAEIPMKDAAKPAIECILKDANGKIVTGFSTYMMSELSVGTPKAFELNSTFKDVQYATYEFYANPWF